MQEYDSRRPNQLLSVDLASWKTAKRFLSHAKWALFHAFFPWDDEWLVFKRMIDLSHGPILIAPVRNGAPGNEAEWIAVTDGRQNDDKPQFSPERQHVVLHLQPGQSSLCLLRAIFELIFPNPFVNVRCCPLAFVNSTEFP